MYKRQLPLLALISSLCLAQNDLKIIKDRIVADLMATPINDGTVAAIMAKMNDDGSFKGINYADLSRTASFPHGGHTRDLVYMAKAYKNKQSK